MNDATTRAALRERIAETSKDEVILDEMIRLGFWRPDDDPHLAELTELRRQRGEARRELTQILGEGARFADPEKALKALHDERKKAARQRRRDLKLACARARQDRAEAWAQTSRDAVWHLGPDVSAALGPKGAPGADALRAPGLPRLPDPAAIAAAMGVTPGELRFLAYARPLARVSHYRRFAIPKKTGGQRIISAPMPRLKFAQYWLLDAVLAKVPIHAAAHGFMPGRSILTNARAHVGRDVVINLDLKDFFPSIDDRRVKGLFQSFGYSEAVAQTLALIATEPVCDEVEIDGRTLWVQRGRRRRLPQGAPSSPMITNLLCRRLDRRLAGLAKKLDFAYTRYADDLTFSASGEATKKVGTLLRAVQDVVRAEGFEPHPDKTRVMRKGARQEVTGLIVNERVGVPREAIRKARAALRRAETKGLAEVRFGSGRDTLAALRGFAQFVAMLDRAQGEALTARVAALTGREAAPDGARGARRPVRLDLRAAAARGALPEGWRWRPAERRAPPMDPVLVAHEREEARKRARAKAATPVRSSPSAAASAAQARSSAWEAAPRRPGWRPPATGNPAPQGRAAQGRRAWPALALALLALLLAPISWPLALLALYFAWRLWRKP